MKKMIILCMYVCITPCLLMAEPMATASAYLDNTKTENNKKDASYGKGVELIKLVLESGSYTDEQLLKKVTPLIATDTNFNAEYKNWNVFHWLAIKNLNPILKLIKDKIPPDNYKNAINTVIESDDEKYTPLKMVINWNGGVSNLTSETVRLFIKMGADLSFKYITDDNNILHQAVYQGLYETVRVILDTAKEKDLNRLLSETNTYCFTPPDFAKYIVERTFKDAKTYKEAHFPPFVVYRLAININNSGKIFLRGEKNDYEKIHNEFIKRKIFSTKNFDK